MNSLKAKLKWSKNGLEVDECFDQRYQVENDILGNSTLVIKDGVNEDSGTIQCWIVGTKVYTKCKLLVKGKMV